ncbi:protoglobin domain-containing protein [Paraburkholderia strydomiana]|uniref:protoglobin domain-containing protein n=1 Tax=Paraburkholderia strydomiana TaxID=1245417 RepID=UPI0038BBF733
MTKRVAEHIYGYSYGMAEIVPSAVSLQQLEDLKATVGFTEDDKRYLLLAGEVLADQTHDVVLRWRSGIIAGIPHLARHSRANDGGPLPDYLAKSNLRFEQWILDTCFRPYDRDWLDYQQEIALRHTSLKKNQTDQVESTSHVPLRDIIGFVAVINETIKPYLASKSHSNAEVEKMHRAWCKSIQLQMALWAGTYVNASQAPNEW